MKDYSYFIGEALGVPETIKGLGKRFRGMKQIKRDKPKMGRLKGTVASGYTIPKVKSQDVRDYLLGLGYKVEEEFDGFIDMYCTIHKLGINYKATIVQMEKDVEVRLSSHSKGKSSKEFRKDTFSQSSAIAGNKFSGKSPRYR